VRWGRASERAGQRVSVEGHVLLKNYKEVSSSVTILGGCEELRWMGRKIRPQTSCLGQRKNK
jgi:hypothetical protein